MYSSHMARGRWLGGAVLTPCTDTSIHAVEYLVESPPLGSINRTDHPPCFAAPLCLALVHVIRSQLDEQRGELVALPPVAPDANEPACAVALGRARLRADFIPLCLFEGMRARKELEFEGVAFVLYQFLVDRMRNERHGLACHAHFGAVVPCKL